MTTKSGKKKRLGKLDLKVVAMSDERLVLDYDFDSEGNTRWSYVQLTTSTSTSSTIVSLNAAYNLLSKRRELGN